MRYNRTRGFIALTLSGLCLYGGLIQRPAQAQTPDARRSTTDKTGIARAYGKLPLAFEANQGQTDPRVKFLAHTSRGTLFLTDSEAVLTMPVAETQGNRPKTHFRFGLNQRPGKEKPAPRRVAILRMKLSGTRKSLLAAGREQLPGIVNYFRGNDPKKWQTDIPTYRQAKFVGVYKGVDMLYYGSQGGKLEYDFVVKPGADPKAIKLAFSGATGARVTATGDLELQTAAGEVRWQRPVTYQMIGGHRETVACAYELKQEGHRAHVGFQLARYDTSRPVVIDPVLVYSTYLGGNQEDQGTSIAVDSNRNAYVTGSANSTNFPTTTGAFQRTINNNASSNAFVTKLSADGSTLLYSTFLGGSHADSGSGIVVDSSGNAYVTGSANSADFPTTQGAFQRTYGGHANAFVAKLNPAGSALIYSTFLGGSGEGVVYADSGSGIAIDSSGDAYVTGSTDSSNFPTTQGAFQRTFGGNNNAFVTKVNSSGSALIYSTYLGGSGLEGDSGSGIAVDSSGDAYVTGFATSTNFPTTQGAFQRTYGGNGNAFVTKLNPAGSALIYSTYLGGSNGDRGNGIAIDSAGNAYVTGLTTSNDFPTTPGAFQRTYNVSGKAFVTKLNPAGSALIYSTYLGGSGQAYDSGDGVIYAGNGSGIAVDSIGSAYVIGSTISTDFPTTPGAFQPHLGSQYGSAFVTRFNPAGSALLYSTYLGGSGTTTGYGDGGSGIAIDSSSSAYVTGYTASFDFPTTSRAFQKAFGGNINAFVAKFSLPLTPGDFYLDGNTDLVFQNSTTGQVAFWDLNGTNVLGGELVNAFPDPGYQVVGVGDFNGDELPDLVFQNQSSGQIAFWYLNKNQVLGGAVLSRIPSPGYKVVGIGDFNGDGQPDFLFQNQTTGQLAVWYMNGSTFLGGSAIADVPVTGWAVVGVGDFNGDGHPDILFQNQTTGQLVVWYMNGITQIGGAAFSQSPYAGWQVRAVADFNHDGSPDLAFQNQATGQVVIWYLNQISVVGGGPTNQSPAAGFLIAGPR